jgi:CRP/FNR family transcriptional regulator, cyclic AMP receptor protein
MAIGPAELRTIPLFQDITDEHLKELLDALQHQRVKEGEVLFQAGSRPTGLLLLTSGEVALKEGEEVRFRLRPVAPIGELGALTGLPRNTTAVALAECEILRIATADLMQFFESHGDVAFPFYHNLLRVVADKVRRDTRRMDEMRANIIRTQKAMKRMRELVLDSEDTVVSKPIFETLDELIEHNKRWNYMVEPAHTLRALVRLDDGAEVPALELSQGWLKIPASPAMKAGVYWSGVLVIPTGEIPISGTVDSIHDDLALVQLDMLISTYHHVLEEYLTRVHMLDFVV